MSEPNLGRIGPLPAGIEVLAGTDVNALWEPFRFYEAGHHLMDIMNPLSPAGLDQVLAAIDLQPTERLLDIACGHGELLLRAAAGLRPGPAPAGEPGQMTGVDLSPWTLRRAHRRLAAAGWPVGLVLGDGAPYLEQHRGETWDVIALVGASWIWGGFEPSVEALVPRLNPGGRLVIAEVIVTSPEVRDVLPAEYGSPLTGPELRAVLEAADLEDLTVIPTTAQDWRDYDDRVMHGIQQWLKTFPQDAQFLQRQEDFESIRAGDSDVTWQVWIGTTGR